VASVAVWAASIDQPTTRREYVQYDGAVDLAFAGGVLGDVGDSQLVRAVSGELAIYEVAGERGVSWSALLAPGSPARPARRMSSSTAPWATRIPRLSRSSASTRRDP
jgi:hypothetical protein